jgi:ABC-2 type transport system permease protein
MSPAQVFITEVMKLRRSKVTWLTWLAFSIMPLVAALFVWIASRPERAAELGLIGAKAQLVGMAADWPGYFALLLQTTGIAGMILVSVLATYVFAREYADGTAKNLLALPVARHWFVLAKLGVVLAWFTLLTLSFVLEGALVGGLLGLPGYSHALLLRAAGNVFLAALVAFLLTPSVAWIAVAGRGYLAALGFTIFMLILGNVFGATGWGKWFPWSIVPLFAGVAGPRTDTLASGSSIVLAATFVAGVGATVWQLRRADNTQ